MILDNAEKSISLEDFSNFEAGFSRLLPVSFRDHYLAHNGGFPEADLINGEKQTFSIDGFISIKYGVLPIEKLLAQMITLLPKKDFVPFANDSGGNIFILSLADHDYGCVYLITAGENERIYVSKSFESFIGGFTNSC